MATKKTSKSKSSSPAKSAAKARKEDTAKRYIASVVLFASAVLFFCIAIVKGEAAWTALHSFMLGLFGWSAYVWPTVMLYSAVLLAMDKDRGYCTRGIVSAASLLLTAQTLVDIFMHKATDAPFFEYVLDCYKAGAKGSGFIGGLIGDGLCKTLGIDGAKIVTIILAFVMLMLMTGTTLIALFKTVSKPAKHIKESVEQAYEKHEAIREDKVKADPVAATSRHPYDVAIEGENPVTAEGKKLDLKKQRQKVVDSFNGNEIEEIVPPVDDADAPPEDDDLFTTPDREREPFTDKEDEIDTLTYDEIAAARGKTRQDIADEPVPEFDVDTDQPEKAYVFPPIDLLNKNTDTNERDILREQSANAEKLVDTLRSFGVETRIIHISRGPSVTRYELQPAAGVRISRIANLTDDIALSLATDGVRIEAPIPNKAAVGIEVPNKTRRSVGVRELIESTGFVGAKSKLTGVLGQDITGDNCYMDISKMPHILVAGTTGSGKSVFLNSMIVSMLYKAKPSEVKMLMIDPKAVEMKVYNGIPHLLAPVVTDPKKAAGLLAWAVKEMLDRYKLLSDYDVRNLDGYNELAEKNEEMKKLPRIVIFIDEFADLMMAAPREVEDSVCRLAQMARAAGMHLVIATQSPRADVITGLIKSNIPSRVALKVANSLESRIILDMQGAERLIGYGDMLFSPTGTNKPTRIQGCWISDGEIKAVTDFLKSDAATAEYDNSIMEEIERQASLIAQGKKAADVTSSDDEDDFEEDDPMLNKALECVVEMGQASTSMLQRKLKLGYSRAARIMDQLESHRYIGPSEGSKPRAVLITPQQLLEMKASGEVDSY